MPGAAIFTWRDGAGWLIVSGGAGGDVVGDVETAALSKIAPGEPIAYIWAASDVESADSYLAALEDSGAPTGYLVDVQTEDDATIRTQLTEAGLIIIGDGPNIGALRGGLAGAASDGLTAAYGRGAIILGIGAGAAALGAKYADGAQHNQLRNGLSWLDKALIVPHYTADTDAPRLRELLAEQPELFGVGLGRESALAFSGDGTVEAWGARQISVTLGTAWTQPNTQTNTQE